MPPVSVESPGRQYPHLAQCQRPASQQPSSTQALADLLDLLNSIFSSSNQAAEIIFYETASLQSQLESKEKELEEVKNEMSKQVIAKQTAIDEMFEANDFQKSKRKEATSEVESLNNLVQEKNDAFSQKEQEIRDTEGRFKSFIRPLPSCSQTLSQPSTILMAYYIKWMKITLIGKMKTSHYEAQKRLKGVEERKKKVEKERSALNASLQATRARLEKIDGNAIEHFDYDENSMWVTSKSIQAPVY